jgi:hypothetical protein
MQRPAEAQYVCEGDEHRQVPTMQSSVGLHARSQPPQCARSADVFTHASTDAQ